jgi:uncharacterized surface protein with fasciclin (FAS1) repeats
MKRTILLCALAAVAAAAVPAMAAKKMLEVTVGGELMYPTRDIVDNAVHSADHTTLVAAVKAAGLVQTLKGPGPFTVFAPTNAAFEDLPAGAVENLLKPENRASLARVLTYHVVPGRLGSEELWKRVRAGGGKAPLATVSGGTLWLRMNGERNLLVVDETGTSANISIYDVSQSNGVIHVIDRVVMPR